jgi:Flp pilus assembly protein TadD
VSRQGRRRRDAARVTASPPSRDRAVWLAPGAVVLLTILTFAPVHSFEFVNYDDFKFIVENPHVAGGLTADNISWAWRNPYGATGGPLTWMSHQLDAELFGPSPRGPHLVNLGLHIASALLLLAVLHAMTGAVWRSALVAALFAIHPLHVESVAWIAERKDVLSGFFWFATIGAYARYVRRRRRIDYALVVLLFAAGLLSKPMVATLPFVLLLLDFWPLKRVTFEGGSPRLAMPLLLEKVPLIALAVAAMWMTLQAQQSIGAVSFADAEPLPTRMANAIVSYTIYLVKTVWPFGLIPFYPYRTNLSVVFVAACAGVLLALTAAAVLAVRRAPFALVGWLWYLGTLVPVSGLVQVGGHAMADRFTYLPLTGILIVIAWGAALVVQRRPASGWLVTATATSMVVVLAVTARTQSLHWRDGIELWEHTVRVDPGNGRAHSNLGVALAGRNRHDEAIREYQQALQTDPDVPQTQHNLGLALEAIGRRDDAIVRHAEAVRLQPDYVKARFRLANLLAERGSVDEAIAQYQEVIRLSPDELLAHANLAVTLGRNGRPAEGAVRMGEAIRLDPRTAQWRYFAGVMLIEAGQPVEAADRLRQALAIDPNHARAREALNQITR